MSKLNELRGLGYQVELLGNGQLDIQLPEGKDLTVRLEMRLNEIKPLLIADITAEQDTKNGTYSFISYMTRKDSRGKGRLVLDLRCNDTGEVVHAYFNVEIKSQRKGNVKKGDYFKTGDKCQFWILPRCKFAIFWLQLFGQPERWSTVYKKMNYLKQFDYTGKLKIAKTYTELTDIRVVRRCI